MNVHHMKEGEAMQKKSWLVVAVFLMVSLIGLGRVAEINPRAIIITPEQPTSLEVSISMDRPEGAVYQPGERVRISFKANKDAYVVIYNIQADGVTTILFPNRFHPDNLVRSGVTYTIPDQRYNLTIDNKLGKEYLQIVASTEQFAVYNTWTQQFQTTPLIQATRDAESDLKQMIQRIIIQPEKPEPEWTSAMTFFYVGSAPNKGTVDFQSSPSGAAIWLDGKWVGQTNLKTTIFEGYHIVRYYLSGYQTYEREFYMQSGSTVVIPATLVPLAPPSQPGRVTVNSVPSNAQVFLDGSFRGMTPITINQVSVGTHTLLLRLSGYQDFQTTFTLSSGEHRTANVTLQRDLPQDGTVKIQVDPFDARVSINGVDYGPAGGELTLTLHAGTHSLSVTRSGYNPYNVSFTLSGGEYKTIPVRLSPLQATVSIRSNPSGARIFIDGSNTGNQTPFQMTLSPGTYQVRLTREGYQDWTTTVTLASGANQEINAALQVLRARLNVQANVTSTVFVNGRSRGTISPNSPISLELDGGLYEVLIVAEGYFSYITRINVRAGESYSINASLVRIY